MDGLKTVPISNLGIRPLFMDFINLIHHMMFNFINSLLLHSRVHVFVITNSISQSFRFLLNLVFGLAFSMRLLRLSADQMVNLV